MAVVVVAVDAVVVIVVVATDPAPEQIYTGGT